MRPNARATAVAGVTGAALAVAVAVVVGACAAPVEVRPLPGVAEIAAGGPDCLADEVLAALPFAVQPSPGSARPAPAAGTVPPGFEPVRVVECRAPGMTTDATSSAGTGTADVIVEEVVLTGDLGPLLAALARSSDPVPADLACPPMYEYQPQLYLIDAAGRAVRPAWPVDRCGFLHDGATAALTDLTELGSTERVAPAG